MNTLRLTGTRVTVWPSWARRVVVLGLAHTMLSIGGPAAHAQARSGAPVSGAIVKWAAPGRVMVQGASERSDERAARVLAAAGLSVSIQKPSRALGTDRHLITWAEPLQGAGLEQALARLRAQPEVLAVEPDVRIRRQAVTPNDPGYSLQWHLAAPTIHPAALNMPAAWDRSTGNTSVTVAVLDTGVRKSHPDLQGRLLNGHDFVSEIEYANDGDGRDTDASDPGDWVSFNDLVSQPAVFAGCPVEDSSWHGTFIAGQIAASTNNSQGVAGIDWRARLLPVRVSGKCGALLSDLLDGMRWAAGLAVAGAPINTQPARVINLSFGGDAPCSAIYQDVIDEITAVGSLLVVAAGNGNGALRRPADCARVLTVGAVQFNGLKASYSNVGANTALMAPGGDEAFGIYSTSNAGTHLPGVDQYGFKLGTSFASPQAAAVAALMLAVHPALTPAQLIELLKASARPHVFVSGFASCGIGNPEVCNCTRTSCGAGLLDADRALALAQSNTAPGTTPQPDGSGGGAGDGSGGGGGAGSGLWGLALWALAVWGLLSRWRRL